MNRREVLAGAAAVGAAAVVGRSAFAMGPVAADPVAKTTNGKVSGGYKAAEGIAWFKGIPYGMDTAKTRFAAPKRPVAWDGVRECVEWGPRAPQTVGARPEYESAKAAEARPGYHLPADEGVQREDCLHVNVWTPGLRDGKKRPVMFYIHGGAFANGTANAQLYDGTRLAKRGDVVVVTVNHRLNSFGYMYLAGQHCGVWRRCVAGDDLWAEWRRGEVRDADGAASGEGFISSRAEHERAAGGWGAARPCDRAGW